MEDFPREYPNTSCFISLNNSGKWEPAKIPTGNQAVAQEKIEFPERNLFDQLIDNYFRQIDGMVPLLNEVLFKRQISERLHIVDIGFATVALLVAAIGSRLCNDPRVFCDPTDTHSRGWKLFSQAQRLQKPLMAPVTLHDMQVVVVSFSIGFWVQHLSSSL